MDGLLHGPTQGPEREDLIRSARWQLPIRVPDVEINLMGGIIH
jgi:hypothetical protein